MKPCDFLFSIKSVMDNIIRTFLLSLAVLICASSFAEHKRFFAYRSFWPEFKAMADFAEAGVNLYAVMPSNAYNSLGEPYCKYPPVWPWEGVYDWNALDAQFDDILKINGKAKFICLIDLNSPLWLAKKIDGGMGIGGDSYGAVSNSACTKIWLEKTEKYLRDFVSHTEAKYGDKIEMYMVAAGGTSEWYDNSNGLANADKIAAWNKWRADKNLSPSNIPQLDTLNQFAFEKRIRDPQTQKLQMEYIAFSSDATVGLMKKFGRIVKEMTKGKKEVGSFAGFLTSGIQARFDTDLTYNNTDIDFFGAPPTYNRTRAVGAAGSFQALSGAAAAAGKGWFHEIDHRTHTYNSQLTKHVRIKNYFNALNQAETDAVLKREFSIASIFHFSLWCFDMWGGVFNSADTMKLVGKSKKIWEKFKDDNSPLCAEIAVVGDPRSALYSRYLYFQGLAAALSDAGLFYEGFSFDDLSKIDLGKYKMIIFPHTFEVDSVREKFLREKVLAGGRTVLFIDAFGISDGKSLDVRRVKKFTGFDYAAAAAVNKSDMGAYKSVFIPKFGDVNGKRLREIADGAGVHKYIESGDPYFANERLLCVHTKNGGRQTVTLPKKAKKVVELYTDRTVLENGDKFEYDFASPDTALFEVFYQ